MGKLKKEDKEMLEDTIAELQILIENQKKILAKLSKIKTCIKNS